MFQCANISSMSALNAVQSEISSLIVSVDHVGIAVTDLTQAINFYQDTLGMHCHHKEINQEQGVEEAMMAFTTAQADIQLLAPLAPDTTIGKFLEKNGPGIQQLAFRVTDVRKVAEILSGKGIRMLYPEPRTGTAGSLVNFAHPKDCGGVLIEFVQHV